MLKNQKWAAFFELTKPRVNALVLVTTLCGFVLAIDEHPWPWLLLFHTMAGTALAALGTCALNECWEKDLDALMNRTKSRPLPAKKLTPLEAWLFSGFISAAGVFYLATQVNFLSALLAFATCAIYIFIYTPLKKRHSLCTLVGAVAGAIPPMIGWAGARNHLSAETWILFAILFLWQVPAFLSIAWMYRADYSRAGFPMLTVNDPQGKATASQIWLGSAALIWVSLFPTLSGLTQWFYFFGALALGVLYFLLGYLFSRSFALLERHAKKIFLASLLYLPSLFFLMLLDKTFL